MFSITGIYTVALGASTSAMGKILIVIPFWCRWACSIPNCPVKNYWNDSVASKSTEECHIPSQVTFFEIVPAFGSDEGVLAQVARHRTCGLLVHVPHQANLPEAGREQGLAAAVSAAGRAVVPGVVDPGARRDAAGEVGGGGLAAAFEPGRQAAPDGREHILRR